MSLALAYAYRMIENRHFRYFLEVAETLHITRAAEHLHIAQPALTQNIQQLEEELGVKLFNRQGRRLSLTEAGRVFREEADRSLKAFYSAQLAAKRAERGEVGRIVIGFQSIAGFYLLPQLFKDMRERYPGVQVSLRELGAKALISALSQGEIDVAIAYALPEKEFSCHELPIETAVVAFPQDHPMASRESVTLAELANEIFVITELDVAGPIVQAFLTECTQNGFEPQIQYVSTSASTLGLISVGFGIGIVPEFMTRVGWHGVVFRPIRNSKLCARLRIMWPTKNPSPIIPKILESLS